MKAQRGSPIAKLARRHRQRRTSLALLGSVLAVRRLVRAVR